MGIPVQRVKLELWKEKITEDYIIIARKQPKPRTSEKEENSLPENKTEKEHLGK